MAKEKNSVKKPVWLKYTGGEVKEIIIKIAEKQPGITAEKIGLILRDNYGIPKTKIYGFKIGAVLKEKKIYSNPDFANLKTKVEKLEKHLNQHKGDKRTGRALIITKAELKKTGEYLNK